MVFVTFVTRNMFPESYFTSHDDFLIELGFMKEKRGTFRWKDFATWTSFRSVIVVMISQLPFEDSRLLLVDDLSQSLCAVSLLCSGAQCHNSHLLSLWFEGSAFNFILLGILFGVH